MQRWKLTLAFDGTDFSGWQKQKEGRTVQGELEKALSTLMGETIEVMGQGRTDSGVHAYGQTAHTDLPKAITERKLLHALRGLLSDDIAVYKAESVAPEFHARFDALSRAYRYQVSLKPNPVLRRSVWQIQDRPDFELLKTCSEKVLGVHDFINFCKPEKEQLSTLCTISRSEWLLEGDILSYRIEANRLLRHMVRRLVGSMVHAAIGRLSVADFDQLLRSDKVEKKAFTAPAKGLILEKVSYPLKQS